MNRRTFLATAIAVALYPVATLVPVPRNPRALYVGHVWSDQLLPFGSISEALAQAQPGDTIYIDANHNHETLKPVLAGRPGVKVEGA